MWSTKPDSVNNPYRASRVTALMTLANYYIKKKGTCRIIDVGGTAKFWNTWQCELPWEYLSILCVNIDVTKDIELNEGRIKISHGDATNLYNIETGSFDIAFSNSVIEHVGLYREMQKFALEIKRIAHSYYVQTPYYWFPLELHARVPFIHWAPLPIAARLVMWKKLGFWNRAKNIVEATDIVESARLLDRKQFEALFDDATIKFERALGLPKSLIAIREPVE